MSAPTESDVLDMLTSGASVVTVVTVVVVVTVVTVVVVAVVIAWAENFSPVGLSNSNRPAAAAALICLAASALRAVTERTILPHWPPGGKSAIIPRPTTTMIRATKSLPISAKSVPALQSAIIKKIITTGVGVVVVGVVVVVVVFVYEVVVVVTVVVVVSVVVVFVTVELVTVELVTVEEVTVEEVTVVHLPATAWFSSDIALYPFVSVRSVEAPIKDWLYVRTPLYVDESNPLVGFPPKNFHCGSASVLLLI